MKSKKKRQRKRCARCGKRRLCTWEHHENRYVLVGEYNNEWSRCIAIHGWVCESCLYT